MQGCCIYVALLKIEPGTPLILPLQPAILSQNRTPKGADLWQQLPCPHTIATFFAELGYAQAEIDARIENANYGSAIDHLKYRHDEFHLLPVLNESGNIA